jgi:hypothetical protein
MEESIFEVMERTHAVDYLLLVLALIGPLLVATLLLVFRNRPIVQQNRHHWTLVFLAGPLLLLLWKIYNAIEDHYGLDSVFALLLNAMIFLATSLVLIALNLVLARVLKTDIRKPE